MADKENKMIISSDGTVSYSNDVVATIAGLAAIGVDGVAGMSGGIASGISEFLGKKDFTKGVRVEQEGDTTILDLNVVIRYGVQMHSVCRQVQEQVQKEIENMTSLKLGAVNVHVVGIDMTEDQQ